MKVRKHQIRARGRNGFPWKPRSSEWLYDALGLFNDYQLRRWSSAESCPSGKSAEEIDQALARRGFVVDDQHGGGSTAAKT